jgi:hypothetical protein
MDFELDRFMQFPLNRGIVLTPLNNMALISPTTTAAQVDRTPKFLASRASVV